MKKNKILVLALVSLLMASGLVVVACSSPCECYKGGDCKKDSSLEDYCPAKGWQSTRNCDCG
ncbi:hypothetical protein [Treponema sp. R8-4-B8]